MMEFIIVLWLFLILAVMVPLELMFLDKHIKKIELWIFMTAIGWILYFIAWPIILDMTLEFRLELVIEQTLLGVVFGLLMGFLRGLSIKKSDLFYHNVVINIILGIFLHNFIIKLLFFILIDYDPFSQIIIMSQVLMFCLIVSYHALNTAALIWLLGDSSSSNQSVDI